MNEVWKIVAAVIITGVLVGSLTYVLKPTPVPPEVAELQARISLLESYLAGNQSEVASLRAQLAAIPPRIGEGLRLYYVSNGRTVCDWWAEAKRGWDNMSEILGVSSYPLLFGEEDGAKEASALSSAIAANPDGIVVSNAFPSVLNPLIMEAVDAGIPVIQGMVFDKEMGAIAPGVYFAFGDDYKEIVDFLAPTIKEKWLGQTINVLCAAIAPDSVYAMLRRQGFEDGLSENGISYNIDLLVLPEEPGAIVEAIKSYLLGHPNVHVYFGCDAHSTDWVGTALRELGYEPGEIIATGADLLPHTVEAIREGYVQTAICMGQWAITQYELIQLILWVKWGYPPRNIGIPGILVTTENLDPLLAGW